MAHNIEPMDIDSSVCDFDDKENAFHHSNVLPRSPCTEKGYEELDVSELNMKLRYSITPASSPMSKSFTTNCLDNRNYDSNENSTFDSENGNLTRSLNSTLTRNDSMIKTKKSLPLQSLPNEQFVENTRNVLRPLDSTVTVDNNVTVTVTEVNDIDENISFPSSSSSLTNTPEATTPTVELMKNEGSPILRGLKSVLNMFRPSQSPVPLTEDEKAELTPEILSPPIVSSPDKTSDKVQPIVASTPLAAYKTKDVLSKRNSPNRDSIVFNEDLEKELQWRDESTIIFSNEKIPIHKLLFQHSKPDIKAGKNAANNIKNTNEKLDTNVEYMDISYNDSVTEDKTMNEILLDGKIEKVESDSEFLDCESTFTKNESQIEELLKSLESDELKEVSADNIKPVDLNTMKETLDATLSGKSADVSAVSNETTKASIEILSPEIVTLPQKTQSEVTQEQIESTMSKHSYGNIEQITNPPEIQSEGPTLEDLVNSFSEPCENFAFTKPIDNILVNNDNVKLDQQALVANDYNNTFDVTNTDTTQIDVTTNISTNITNTTVSVPTLENIVIKSLSQIPLISDPRVLLFNIPSGELIGEVSPQENIPVDSIEEVTSTQPQQETTGMDASPADIPLPDDDDTENLVSLPTLDLINEVVVADVSSLNVNQNQNSSQVETTPVDINSGVEFKDVNIIADICETVLPLNVSVTHELIKEERKFDANQFVEEKPSVVSNDIYTLPEPVKDEHQIDINEFVKRVPDLQQTDSVKINSSVANSIAFIPDIVDIPPKSDLPDLVKAENVVNPINEHVFYERNGETENKVFCETRDEIPIEKKSVVEELIASLNDIVKETTVLDNVISLSPDELLNTTHSISEPVSVALNDNDVEKQVEDAENKLLHDLRYLDINRSIEVNKDLVEMNLNINKNIVCQIEAIELQTNKIISDTLDTKEVIIEKDEDNLPINVNHCIENDVTITPSGHSSVTLDNQLSEAEIVEDKNNDTVPNAVSITAPVSETENHTIEISAVAVAEEKQGNITLEDIEMKSLENNVKSTSVPVEIIVPTSITPDIQVQETVQIENKDVFLNANIDVTNETTKPPEDAEKSSNIIPSELDQNQENKMEIEDIKIVTSENNSPFVSVSVEDLKPDKSIENLEVENSFVPKSKAVVSPSVSPKIVSKGYNFNFDEIEDPFATKTRIRMSPSPDDSSNQSFKQAEDPVENIDFPQFSRKEFNKNRRKSQPARQKPSSKKLNSTFAGSSNVTKQLSLKKTEPITGKKVEETKEKTSMTFDKTFDSTGIDAMNGSIKEMVNFTSEIIKSGDTSIFDTTEKINEVICNEENKSSVGSISPIPSEIKNTSSSEQSTYFSANTGTSSNEGIESKNVFNIPEIADQNFNPFATKSKMRASPPPVLERDPFTPKNKLRSSPEPQVKFAQDKIITDTNTISNSDSQKQIEPIIDKTSEDKLETGLEEKESLSNVSSATCSSKTTDEKDITVQEIHTEDEDTVEGPFLEAEDLNDDKLSDFDGEHVDMMQFSEIPPESEDNAEGGELFIDAEAFEFLLNQNKCNTVADSGKESLFLKFDPLFAKRVSSDGVVAALNKIQKRQSTPKKMTKPSQKDDTFVQNYPVPGPSLLNVTHEVDCNSTAEASTDDLNITVSKPMMVVNPAVNPVVATRKSITPVRSNRRSLTFTSPAIAVIDRLLSLSANNSLIDHNTTIAEVSREQSEADIALTQLRELLADKEISVYNLRSETKNLKERLANLESQMKNLESVSEERLKKINELTEKLNEKTKINKNMATVVEEYERTIASLIAQTEQDKKRNAEERVQLIKERDEQTAHLASMEVSFSDLHSKYEKSKQVILGFKANEDTYKKAIKEFEDNLSKMQNNYELLKQHATSKLNHANDELQKMNRAHEAEVLKLNAMIKRKELHITSLEETLLQKTKANDELTAICDELINKVG